MRNNNCSNNVSDIICDDDYDDNDKDDSNNLQCLWYMFYAIMRNIGAL